MQPTITFILQGDGTGKDVSEDLGIEKVCLRQCAGRDDSMHVGAGATFSESSGEMRQQMQFQEMRKMTE